jgi:hypothetical protein
MLRQGIPKLRVLRDRRLRGLLGRSRLPQRLDDVDASELLFVDELDQLPGVLLGAVDGPPLPLPVGVNGDKPTT